MVPRVANRVANYRKRRCAHTRTFWPFAKLTDNCKKRWRNSAEDLLHVIDKQMLNLIEAFRGRGF
jgi:hypothetical protein